MKNLLRMTPKEIREYLNNLPKDELLKFRNELQIIATEARAKLIYLDAFSPKSNKKEE